MDNLLTMAFEAHNAEKNHHRRYSITVGRDLFDDWTVSVRYGRVGRRGQELRFAGPKPEAMQAVVRNCLKKRMSARRRIGCDYRITALDVASGFDGFRWLPTDVLTHFRHSVS